MPCGAFSPTPSRFLRFRQSGSPAAQRAILAGITVQAPSPRADEQREKGARVSNRTGNRPAPGWLDDDTCHHGVGFDDECELCELEMEDEDEDDHE